MAGVSLFSNTNIAAMIKAKLYDRMMFWKYRLLAWTLKLNVAYYDAPAAFGIKFWARTGTEINLPVKYFTHSSLIQEYPTNFFRKIDYTMS